MVKVAPRAGAWIETRMRWDQTKSGKRSPLAQGRGLKPDTEWEIVDTGYASPLAQGRGLKLMISRSAFLAFRSPLAQGRGLKHAALELLWQGNDVAPRAGAWIETIGSVHYELTTGGRPSRRGVD